MSELERRRQFSNNKFEEIRKDLKSSEDILKGKACVYATGSYGRQEASKYSDLDLFIIGLNIKGEKDEKNDRKKVRPSQLRGLDAICVKADLIEATRNHKIKDFDGDGKYLDHFSVDRLTKTLGTPEDDAANTFTARVLLLLESSPLLGGSVYNEIIAQVLEAYWRDYQDHKSEFVPAFIVNDILRLWRTFCVNYEARTQREPDSEKAKGKLKNYKLKHGRILTCYSAILYLLAIYERNKTVSPNDAEDMVSKTPTKRLEWLLEQEDLAHAHDSVRKLIEQYNKFLTATDIDEAALIDKFSDKKTSKEFFDDANEFGNMMSEALQLVGNNSRLHRLIIV